MKYYMYGRCEMLENNITILDLRELPPRERHQKIFELWKGIPEGHILRIINDHDPRPLYYQFAYEEMGKFEWTYEQQGPVDWIVNIKKI
jgi:uncharacterized protein (DUF2249 family)